MSQHFDEKTIELIVLGSDKVASERDAFFEHIRGCGSCAAVHEEMRQFHAALSGPAALTQGDQEFARGLKVSPSFGSDLTRSAPDHGVVARIWHRHRKAAVSFGSIAMVGVAALILSLRTGVRGANPHHAVFDPSVSAVRITDVAGSDMFTIPLQEDVDALQMHLNSGNRTVIIDDLDGNGKNEVITTLPAKLRGVWRSDVVRVFAGDGMLLWKKELGDTLRFGQEQFAPQFQSRGLATFAAGSGGMKHLLVGAPHTHSPFILYRLDERGTEIGQYRNLGHLSSFRIIDLDDDGRPELLTVGVQHYHEFGRRALLVAIDPSEIRGVTEASFSEPPGFGVESSGAERRVYRFPLSFIDTLANQPLPFAADIRVLNADHIGVDVWSTLEGKLGHWNYVFNTDLIPIQVKWADSVRELHAQLRREGRIAFDLSHDITDRMLHEIEVWDGQEWRPVQEQDGM